MVKGGGAQAASDKVVQHNGKGTVTIDGFSKQSRIYHYTSYTNLLRQPLWTSASSTVRAVTARTQFLAAS
jgi:hypothetical protein